MTQSDGTLRLCLVTGRWSPRFSGAALRFRQYLPRLREQGVEVEVMCSTPPGDRPTSLTGGWEDLALGEALRTSDDGTLVHRVKLPAGPSLRRNLLYRAALARHLAEREPRIVQYLTLEPLRTHHRHSPGHGSRALFTGTQLSSLSGNPLKRRLQEWWIRTPIEKTDHVVVSSSVMGRFYEALGIKTPISVIPNGVDLEMFHSPDPEQQKSQARQDLGLRTNAQVVLFIGSIIHRKGVDVLLEAFARVAASKPLAELVIVGPHDDSDTEEARAYGARVRDLVLRTHAVERVHFAGYVTNVGKYMQAADVFVFPSRREGMGNVVLEAMAMGIPTVLTPYLGLPDEFGVPGEQYVLTNAEAGSLALEIEDLLTDNRRREALRRKGRDWVERHMDMSSVVDAYVEVYRALATHGEARTGSGMNPWIE